MAQSGNATPDSRAAFDTSLKPTWPRSILLAILAVGTFALLAYGVMALLWPKSPRSFSLYLVTDVEPHRNLLGQQIRDEARRHGLDINLSAKNQGTMLALEAADTADADKLAMVPGGISARDYPNIRLVTMLTNEPLHVMVRPELVEGGLPALRGRRVNIGPDATASHQLARGVLAFVGLAPTDERGPAGYTLDATASDDLNAELNRIESLSGPERKQAVSQFPDAVIFLAPLSSQLAKRLVAVVGFQLVPIPFADAFCIERLQNPMAGGIRIDRAVLSTVVIPPYTYGGNPSTPPQPTSTLAAPLLLIAQDAADPDAIARLLETIFDSPLKNGIHPPPLADQCAAFPFHAGSERFLRRHDPLLSPILTAKIGSITGGIASFTSGIIGFYTYLRVRKLRRFELHYRELSQLQLLARGQLEDPGCPKEQKARLAYIENRLTDLQSRVFRNFALGGLRGESQLADMNSMINDLRERVVRRELESDPASSNDPPAATSAQR